MGFPATWVGPSRVSWMSSCDWFADREHCDPGAERGRIDPHVLVGDVGRDLEGVGYPRLVGEVRVPTAGGQQSEPDKRAAERQCPPLSSHRVESNRTRRTRAQQKHLVEGGCDSPAHVLGDRLDGPGILRGLHGVPAHLDRFAEPDLELGGQVGKPGEQAQVGKAWLTGK